MALLNNGNQGNILAVTLTANQLISMAKQKLLDMGINVDSSSSFATAVVNTDGENETFEGATVVCEVVFNIP